MEQFGKIRLFNCDCMELMKTTPDKYYDLAIVDLEYNIGASKPSEKPCLIKQKNGNVLAVKNTKYTPKKWDFQKSSPEYFEELFRVSKKQIIWGGNYYGLEGGYLVWDKLNGESDQFGCEMAWLSFTKRTDIIYYMWGGMFQGVYCGKDLQRAITQQGNKQLNEKRIHPTQKPIKLYEYLLKEYAQPEYSILDTHVGSLSIGIACDRYGCKLDACEKDLEYYELSKQRFINYKKQLTLF